MHQTKERLQNLLLLSEAWENSMEGVSRSSASLLFLIELRELMAWCAACHQVSRGPMTGQEKEEARICQELKLRAGARGLTLRSGARPFFFWHINLIVLIFRILSRYTSLSFFFNSPSLLYLVMGELANKFTPLLVMCRKIRK